MAEADYLRKAMGKKIVAIMTEHRERFTSGAVKNGISKENADKIFNLIEKFGGYGFNKSHSAAYALIAYQTAYLKAHFPVEFMASLLTSEMHSTDGVVKYIAECRSHDLPILPPDINESSIVFNVSDSKIRFGLVAVKNVGEGAIESIMETRKEGAFKSLFDFCERVDLQKVNKRVLESLIKCGAFDSTGDFRSRMLAVLEDVIEQGQMIQKERSDPQIGLFEVGDSPQPSNFPPLPEIDEWNEKQLLTYEKESLGFYFSGHPLTRFEDILEKFTDVDAISIKEKNDGDAVRIGGIVTHTKTIKTRRGDLMAFVTSEDLHGSVETTIFSSVYQSVSDLLIEDVPILIQGRVQKDEKSVKILADTIIPVNKVEETWTASVHFNLDLGRTTREVLTGLSTILKRHPGACKAYLCLQLPEKTDTVIAMSGNLKIAPGKALRREVNTFLGYNAVTTKCSDASSSMMKNGNKWNGRKGRPRHA